MTTEQPDTTAIRAEYRNLERQGVRVPRSAFLLLDALDDARAERDDERRWRVETYEKLVVEGRVKNRAIDRAEAAEAELARRDAAIVAGQNAASLRLVISELVDERDEIVHRSLAYKLRAEAAEARIAAALAIDDDGELTRGDRIKAMRRALTEGAGR